MVCTHCSHETRVINSRLQKKANQVWRRRKCEHCLTVFTTTESVEYAGVWQVWDDRQSGQSKSKAMKGSVPALPTKPKQLQPFSRDRLFLSILDSLKHRATAIADASGLADTVIRKLTPDVTSGLVTKRQIAQTVQVALNRFDKVASVYYQAFQK